MAQLLYYKLSDKGFDIFYDIESLKAGAFDRRLLLEIEKADYILLILPPHGLDRCVDNEDDWVRQEISHALSIGKPVVPVMLRDFEFPAVLPDDIDRIRMCHGIKFDDMNFLEAKIDKLIEIMQYSDNEVYDIRKRKSGPALIANVCTEGSNNPSDPFPKNKYSPIIRMDMYSVVYFHGFLAKPFMSQRVHKTGYTIYDENDNLIKEHELDIEFKPGDDKFSLGWIVVGDDGSYMRAGKYRVYM